jgi:hypothetical protein
VTATAVALRERPILFSGPMVRAILEGRKTQTRRVVAKPEIAPSTTLVEWNTANKAFVPWNWSSGGSYAGGSRTGKPFASPYGVGGDRLWVRESFAGPDHIGDGDQGVVGFGIEYKADGAFRAHGDCGCDGPCSGVLIAHPWKPSIHMPRWASRLALELTDVHVERLQAITNDDAVAEGIERWGSGPLAVQPETRALCQSPRAAFGRLWDSLNAKRGYGWDVNPWVWVLAFRRVA